MWAQAEAASAQVEGLAKDTRIQELETRCAVVGDRLASVFIAYKALVSADGLVKDTRIQELETQYDRWVTADKREPVVGGRGQFLWHHWR